MVCGFGKSMLNFSIIWALDIRRPIPSLSGIESLSAESVPFRDDSPNNESRTGMNPCSLLLGKNHTSCYKYYVTKVGDGIVPYFTLRSHKRMGKSDSQRFSDQ